MPTIREAYFEALKLGVPKEIAAFALQEINGFNHLELTKHFDDEIKSYPFFKESIKRYLDGEMIEYIFNKSYFLSTPFYVDKNVLIPRQETEQLVLETKKLINEFFKGQKITIADVCSGSGIIGLSLKKMLPLNDCYLSDISKEAIRVSKTNAKNLGLNDGIFFFEGDMLKPFIVNNIRLDVIVCNPPYIKDIKTIDERTWKQEPHLALLADPDTKFYEDVFLNSSHVLNKKHLMAFEIGEDMEDSLTELVKKYCSNSEFYFQKDIYGKTRFLFIKHQ